MLTAEQLESNKLKFIDLIKSISVEGADIEGLINYLETSDFFYAPASVKYHCSYAGGLCEHSLDVYNTLCKLLNTTPDLHYSEDTIKIVGLLHEISKANFYETYKRNVKNEEGKWEQVEEFKVREPDNRLLAGSKGFNSYLIISRFLPLLQEEVVAIINQYAGTDKTENTEDLSTILNKYKLTVLLHSADMISMYCLESL